MNFLFSSFFCVTCLKTPVDKSTISRHFFIYIHFKEQCLPSPVPLLPWAKSANTCAPLDARAREGKITCYSYFFFFSLLIFAIWKEKRKEDRTRAIAFLFITLTCVCVCFMITTLTFFFFFLSLYISLYF